MDLEKLMLATIGFLVIIGTIFLAVAGLYYIIFH